VETLEQAALVRRGRKSICQLCDVYDWSTIRRWSRAKGFPIRRGWDGRPFVFVAEVREWFRNPPKYTPP